MPVTTRSTRQALRVASANARAQAQQQTPVTSDVTNIDQETARAYMAARGLRGETVVRDAVSGGEERSEEHYEEHGEMHAEDDGEAQGGVFAGANEAQDQVDTGRDVPEDVGQGHDEHDAEHGTEDGWEGGDEDDDAGEQEHAAHSGEDGEEDWTFGEDDEGEILEGQPSQDAVVRTPDGQGNPDAGDSSDGTDSAYDSEDYPSIGAEIAGRKSKQIRQYETIGQYGSLLEAVSAMEAFDGGNYKYGTRYYRVDGFVRTYVCTCNPACTKHMKIRVEYMADDGSDVQDRAPANRFVLQHHGKHNRPRSNPQVPYPPRPRVATTMKAEADKLLMLGYGAARVLVTLEHKYRHETAMLRALPTKKQLENRKAYLSRKLTGGWEFKTPAHVREWAAGRLCQTREAFEAIPDGDSCMLVLDFFEASFEDDDGVLRDTFGVIVSSKALLANVARSVEGQPGSLLCSTDGTYKLHFGGWTLVDCGSEAVVYDDNTYRHRFVPWAYMFVRTESEVAYTRLFQVVRDTAMRFLDVDLRVKFGCLDHSWAIVNAFRAVWPDVKLLTCWPHVVRQCTKKKKLLVDQANWEQLILPQLRLLHEARTIEQFVAVADKFVEGWIEAGETDYASWFQEVYLAEPWGSWFVGASAEPGILPSQQAIESHHASIKRIAADKCRAPTAVVLSTLLPKILLMDASNACEHVRHYAIGPLDAETLLKTQLILRDERNYKPVIRTKNRRRTEIGIAFNSKGTMLFSGNLNGAAVTTARVTLFMKSTTGRLEADAHASNLAFDALSLHLVSIKEPIQDNWPHFGVQVEQDAIEWVREHLSCTCKAHVHSGWFCSHIFATLALKGVISIDRLLSTLPVRRRPGRPPARGPALAVQNERDPEGFYSIARLTNLFIKRPGAPLRWRLVEVLDVEDNGRTREESFVATVASVRMEDGKYVWSAHFADRDVREFDAHELAIAVHRAHELGVEVI